MIDPDDPDFTPEEIQEMYEDAIDNALTRIKEEKAGLL